MNRHVLIGGVTIGTRNGFCREKEMEQTRKFGNPPVVETVLGVQFAPIALTSLHFGWFWREFLDKEWTKPADAQPLPDQFEKFGEHITWGIPGFQLAVAAPAVRVQIANTADDRVIQIQSNRFLYNWRKQQKVYPSYGVSRDGFFLHFEKFRNFLTHAGFPQLNLNQWEVSYVDHIPKGTLWQTPEDWRKILPGLLGMGKAVKSLRFEGTGEWHFEIEPQRGRLHLALQVGRLDPMKGPEVLILHWIARGPILDKPGWGLEEGFDLGHDVLTRAFLEWSSPESQKSWS